MEMNEWSWFKRKSVQDVAWKSFAFVLISIGAIAVLVPFLWMLSSSLKKAYQVLVFPPVWIPDPVVWSNYSEALVEFYPFVIYFRNTALITLGNIVGSVISCSLVAYAFARLRFPAKDFLFLVVLSTMMVPYHITLIPLYILFKMFGWIDTFKPLVVPAFFGNAFFIFLLRQFFMTIPLEMDDAAKIDGCGILRIYWHIILPMSKPALATIVIFSFMGNWNDFLYPLIFLNSESKRTLTIALTYFTGPRSGQTYLPHLMAASTAVTIPPLILFFFSQKYFIQGIVVTGIKG